MLPAAIQKPSAGVAFARVGRHLPSRTLCS